MPLDRTWYNSLIDDDGSNTVGSIWNKASVDSLMDAVDADKAVLSPYVNLAPSGVLANYDPPGGAAALVWILSPAAGSYLTGIVAPAVAGTQHLLINGGSGITISNAHSASAAANQFYGPGYADFTLASWYSVWIYYSPTHSKWIVLKP